MESTDSRSGQTQWYALYTDVRQERNVERSLLNRGLEVYLPRLTDKGTSGSQAMDNSSSATPTQACGARTVVRPIKRLLFPRYVFARCNVAKPTYLGIKKTIGVKYFVGYDGAPTPIPEEQIDSIRILLGGREHVSLHPALQVGRQVRVLRGPFRGALGHLVEISRNHHRLVVNLDMLSSSIAVNIEAADVEPY